MDASRGENGMKILIVNRFFGGAQIPTGRMAEDVARVLVEGGHEVTALASSGEYVGAVAQALDYGTSGRRDDPPTCSPWRPAPAGQGRLSVETVNVPKWMPRALAWVWFTWQARKRIPRMDWDVCVLMTDPPLLPLLAARVKAADGLRDYGTTGPRDATRRVAVWLMDLYPEALAASGRVGRNNPLYKRYFSRRQHSLAAAQLLICLGDQQRTLLGDALTKQVRTAVLPPWDDRGNITLATGESLQNLALYAGNLGEAHCFEEILAAAPYLPPDWTIRFAARGAKRSALLSKLRSDEWRVTGDESGSASANDSGVNSGSLKLTDLKLKTAGAVVHVSGYASEEETPGLLASARVHLITMLPGWEGIVVPSKLYGCVRTGRPVLFIGPENADTAREIRAHDWGKVLPPGASGEDVAGAILELAARETRSVQPQQGAGAVAKLIQALATD